MTGTVVPGWDGRPVIERCTDATCEHPLHRPAPDMIVVPATFEAEPEVTQVTARERAAVFMLGLGLAVVGLGFVAAAAAIVTAYVSWVLSTQAY